MKYTATDLQEIAIKAALSAGKIDPSAVSSVICGNVFHVRIVFEMWNFIHTLQPFTCHLKNKEIKTEKKLTKFR